MIASLHRRSRPLRFLLYLEWILLGIMVSAELFPMQLLKLPRLPLLNLGCLVMFGLMGLRLPADRPLPKVLYTSLEFGLIALASLVGGIPLVPLLYIIFITRNSLIFGRFNRSIVAGLAVLLWLLTQIYRVQQPNFLNLAIVQKQLGAISLSFTLLLILIAVFLQLLVDTIFSEQKSRQQLASANEQLASANERLRRYALQIEDIAMLQERNRIAREIHDSLGHVLTVLNLHLEAALKLGPSNPREAVEFLAEAKQLGSKALHEVRESVSTLRTGPLHDRTLESAIATLVEDFHRSTGILPLSQIEIQQPLSAEVETAIYRILQEALTNICRHASATEVSIQILGDQDLQVRIQDNGCGFDRTQNLTGFGLQGMHERTLAIGGSFEVVTAPASGCTIVACFPLSEQSQLLNPNLNDDSPITRG